MPARPDQWPVPTSRPWPESGASVRRVPDGSECVSLSEPARNVIFRPLVRRIGKDFLRPVKLDQVAHQEESRELRHPRRLLHVMSNDNDRKPLLQLENQIFDFRG